MFVNPEHVVMIREERRLKEMNERGVINENLNKNHRFSKLTINRGQSGTDIVVIGAPDLIETKLQRSTKQLLRG